MGNEMLVGETICLVYVGSKFVGGTISCETCLRWFHFNCGVECLILTPDPCVQIDHVPYFSPSCPEKRRLRKQKTVPGQGPEGQNCCSPAESAHSEDLKVIASDKSEKEERRKEE